MLALLRAAVGVVALLAAGAAAAQDSGTASLPWIQGVTDPAGVAYLEAGGDASSRAAPRVWIQAGPLRQARLTAFSAGAAATLEGCIGTREDRCRPASAAREAAARRCLQSDQVTHYFTPARGRRVLCLSLLPDGTAVMPAAAVRAPFVDEVDARWEPRPAASRSYLHDLFRTAPAWSGSDRAIATVACQHVTTAVAAYATRDYMKDLQGAGRRAELTSPDLVWSWKYLARPQRAIRCGAARYTVDHVATPMGLLPDGTVLLYGRATVLRVRLSDGSTDAPASVLQRVAPRSYIEQVLAAAGSGCRDGHSPCPWTDAPGARTRDAEAGHALRWFEGLDRTVQRIFFRD